MGIEFDLNQSAYSYIYRNRQANMPRLLHGKVYVIWNTKNWKFYIGSTKKRLSTRWKRHYAMGHPECKYKESKSKFYTFMKQIGRENFKIELIEDLVNVTEIEIKQREFYWIDLYRNDPELLNTYKSYEPSEERKRVWPKKHCDICNEDMLRAHYARHTTSMTHRFKLENKNSNNIVHANGIL